MKIILIRLQGATDQDMIDLSEELNNTKFCQSRPDYTIMISNKTYKPHTLDTGVYDKLEQMLETKQEK